MKKWNNKKQILDKLENNSYNNYYIFRDFEIDEELLSDKEFVLECVKRNNLSTSIELDLEYIPLSLRNDREFILSLPSLNERNFKTLSTELQEDKDIVLKAIRSGGNILPILSEDLKNDFKFLKEVIEELFKTSYSMYAIHFFNDSKLPVEFLDKYLIELSEISLSVIYKYVRWHNPSLLERLDSHYSKKFTSIEFATEILQKDPNAFQLFPLNIRDNEKIIKIALSKKPKNLKYVSSEIQEDKKFIYEIFDSAGILTIHEDDIKETSLAYDVQTRVKYAIWDSETVHDQRYISLLENDKDYLLRTLKTSRPALFQHANETIKNDKEFIDQISQETDVYDTIYDWYLPQERRSDTDTIISYLKKITSNTIAHSVLSKLPRALTLDKTFFLEVLNINGYYLKFASSLLQADKDFVMVAVNNNGLSLEFASLKLRNDKEVIECAFKNDERSKKYMLNDLPSHAESILEQISSDGLLLEHIEYEYHNDKSVVTKAVSENGNALEFASEELRDDKTIVIEAVKQNGNALRFASDILRDNKTVVTEAVKQNGKALFHVCEELRDNKTVVSEAVKQNGNALWYASDRLRDDKTIVMEAVKQDENALEYASRELKNDKTIVMEAIKKDGNTLEFASEELRDDKIVVMEAIAQTGYSLRYASDKLRDNKKIVLIALDTSPYTVEFISDRLKDDNEVISKVIEHDKNTIIFASDRLKKKLSLTSPEHIENIKIFNIAIIFSLIILTIGIALLVYSSSKPNLNGPSDEIGVVMLIFGGAFTFMSLRNRFPDFFLKFT